jgi:hypothetical protein
MTMTIAQELAGILDETVKALSNLDSAKLNALVRRIGVLAESSRKDESDIGLALPKKCELEIVLQNRQANLDALTRLHARNMRNQWAQ